MKTAAKWAWRCAQELFVLSIIFAVNFAVHTRFEHIVVGMLTVLFGQCSAYFVTSSRSQFKQYLALLEKIWPLHNDGLEKNEIRDFCIDQAQMLHRTNINAELTSISASMAGLVGVGFLLWSVFVQ